MDQRRSPKSTSLSESSSDEGNNRQSGDIALGNPTPNNTVMMNVMAGHQPVAAMGQGYDQTQSGDVGAYIPVSVGGGFQINQPMQTWSPGTVVNNYFDGRWPPPDIKGLEMRPEWQMNQVMNMPLPTTPPPPNQKFVYSREDPNRMGQGMMNGPETMTPQMGSQGYVPARIQPPGIHTHNRSSEPNHALWGLM